jgi:hypothetical protein
MKKIVLFSAILLSTITVSFGQVTVENVNINDLDIKYCQLIGYNKSLFGKNIIVTVDYGQKFKPFKSQLIKGPDDKAIEFYSMIDALNFMEENGWEYVNNYAVSTGNSSVYHYLLKKKE